MDPQGQFVATLVDASRKAFAVGAVTRLSAADRAEVERWGFRSLAADAEMRLVALSEALAAGRPEILEIEAEWLAAAYTAREVPIALLEGMLRALRDELADSLPPEAAHLAVRTLEAALAVVERGVQVPAAGLSDGMPHVELARSFLQAVLEGRRCEAERLVLDAWKGGVDPHDLHLHVVERTLAEIGRRWHVGDVHVAEEHVGSRIVEHVLAVLRSQMGPAQENGRSVLVASVRGNLHDIGARIVADHFERAGWRALFLGADTPASDLAVAVGHFDADLVAISAGLGLNVRAVAELLAEVRAAHPDVPILVGGRLFSLLPDLWKTVGADGSATDAAGAVRAGARLVPNGA